MADHPACRETSLNLSVLNNVPEMIRDIVPSSRPGEVITALHRIPSREAEWTEMPGWIRPELAEAYRSKGIVNLYSHQAEAAERIHSGKNVVIVTPTASGKTLCYNLTYSIPSW